MTTRFGTKTSPARGNGTASNLSLVNEIGKAVEYYRTEKLHVSQRILADRAGVSRETLRHIEGGTSHDYSIRFVERIVSCLEVDLLEFVAKARSLSAADVYAGGLKGEFEVRYPEEGLKITALSGKQRDFFFGLFQLEAKRSIVESKLPHAEALFFHGFRGKMVFHWAEREYLLSEEKHLLFRHPAAPAEIYNPDQIREASCFILTVPSFL